MRGEDREEKGGGSPRPFPRIRAQPDLFPSNSITLIFRQCGYISLLSDCEPLLAHVIAVVFTETQLTFPILADSHCRALAPIYVAITPRCNWSGGDSNERRPLGYVSRRRGDLWQGVDLYWCRMGFRVFVLSALFRVRVGPFCRPSSYLEDSSKVVWFELLLCFGAVINPVASNCKATGAELACIWRSRTF